MILESAFAAIYLAAAATSLWSRSRIQAFLVETRSIADQRCLARFKDLVRLQMYLALAMIVLLVSGLFAGLVLITRHGLAGLLGVLLANAVVLGLGLFHKQAESRLKALPAATEDLAGEHRRVCESWTGKPFPDF